jgi:RNA polymerase sigma-70 factor, ECF subfamily
LARPGLKYSFENPLDDTTLVARVKAGDMAAARELYDAHAGHVYRLIYRLAGESDLADDCMQDTFIRVFQRIGEYRGEASIGTWIRKVAASVTLNSLRSSKRFRSREVTLELADSVEAVGTGDPHLRARLKQAIADLPEHYRLVFIMYDVEGYSHEEIGKVLGLNEGTSKARLSRARARLRRALSDFAEWREA